MAAWRQDCPGPSAQRKDTQILRKLIHWQKGFVNKQSRQNDFCLYSLFSDILLAGFGQFRAYCRRRVYCYSRKSSLPSFPAAPTVIPGRPYRHSRVSGNPQMPALSRLVWRSTVLDSRLRGNDGSRAAGRTVGMAAGRTVSTGRMVSIAIALSGRAGSIAIPENPSKI